MIYPHIRYSHEKQGKAHPNPKSTQHRSRITDVNNSPHTTNNATNSKLNTILLLIQVLDVIGNVQHQAQTHSCNQPTQC